MIATSAARVPLFLDLVGRWVLVVGGGPVAARRARDLSDAGAKVVLVAPYACEDVVDLERAGRLVWLLDEYSDEHLDKMWLVITATGDAATDAAVVAAADSRRIWAVNAGDAQGSPAWSAAVAHGEDGIAVAVSGGRDPRRAVAIRNAITSLLAEGALPTRRRRRPSGRRGAVYLVGGGPGHADLLTVRGSRLLGLADVVVIDRLAPWSALDALEDDVEVIDVGKAPGNHALPQEAINALLVDRANEGKVVVRLKGGDPFVLGRGGEEVLACAQAGVTVEVVPGVTSAIAVPAAAGIPVTHRGVAQSFLMASAHDAEDALAQIAGVSSSVTIVLLMGVGRLAELTTRLIESGRDPATPVAIIERGWTPTQRTTAGRLDTIAAAAAARGVESPAVIVIGRVVDLGLASHIGPAAVKT